MGMRISIEVFGVLRVCVCLALDGFVIHGNGWIVTVKTGNLGEIGVCVWVNSSAHC